MFNLASAHSCCKPSTTASSPPVSSSGYHRVSSCPNLLLCAEFHWNLMICHWDFYGDLIICNMAALCHLELSKFRVYGTCLYHHAIVLPCAKFHWNWIIGCWVMAKKRFLKWRPSAILNLKKNYIWLRDLSGSIFAFVYQSSSKSGEFCRAMLCKRGLWRHAVSVCSSVRPSVCHVRGLYRNE